MEELQRQAGWAKSFGLPIELISAAEAQQLFPPMSTEGVLGAAFLPQDGYLDPSQLTFALADGARLRGAEIEQRTRVTGITLRDGRVHEVVTDRGTIRTDVVINAGGMYAPQIARDGGRARCRSSPTRTSSWSPRRSTRRCSRCRRCATPTTSSTGAPRWAA